MYENKKKIIWIDPRILHIFNAKFHSIYFFYPFPWLLGLLGSDAESRELQW